MSIRNLDRVLRVSEAEGAARMALGVVAFYGHDDGVLDNTKYSLPELARRGGMVPDTWTRATRDLARAGELVILQQRGRYARLIYGVVCGLYGLDRLEVIHAAWARAAVRGGTFSQLDDLTLRGDWTAVEPVMLDVQSRRLVVINPELNPDFSSSNPDEKSGLKGGLSIDVFLVPREQQQHARGEKDQVRRLTPAQEKRRVKLQLLGVYPLKARSYASSMPLAWVDQVIEAGMMIREGTDGIGAAVCAMMEGKEPLPAFSPATPRVLVRPEERQRTPFPPEDVKRYGVRGAALLHTNDADALRAMGEWQLAEERERRNPVNESAPEAEEPRAHNNQDQ